MPLYLNGKQITPVKLKIIENGDYPFYQGPYVTRSKINNTQTLPTAYTVLQNNIIVEPVQYSETANLAGGYTFHIGE